MLITKEVEIRLRGKNIKWFENKGYNIPKWIDRNGRMSVKEGTKIKVKVEDLLDNSNVLVDIQCDNCKEILNNTKWSVYKKCAKEDGKYYCQRCAIKLYGHDRSIKSHIKNNGSFYDWCYESLSTEEADKLMLRWDYDLNIRNNKVLSPSDIGYGSQGFNKQGYWFKCLDHPEHGSELRNTHDFVDGSIKNLDCSKCNSISMTHPHLVKYFINKDDALKYSFGSNKKVKMKCPNCGHEKEMSIVQLVNQGLGCSRCSDGISYPEKFISNMLDQLKISFITQLSKKKFTWCDKYLYDYYLYETNTIIETHGLQHYKNTMGSWNYSTLSETQENDNYKEHLAKSNNIINYIVLDCRKSELELIKNSVMESKLPQLLNFKEDNIDWLKCHEMACSSLVKIACDMWNNGIKNTLKIANELKVRDVTIISYLKQGVKLGWCDYDPKKTMNKYYTSLKVKIICLTTREIFDSIKDANIKYNANYTSISKCCKGKAKSAGKHPVTGEKMVWMYYDEYIDKVSQESTNNQVDSFNL
jgi:hypothetical protein